MCLSRYQDDRRQWQLVSGSSGSDDILPAKPTAQTPAPVPTPASPSRHRVPGLPPRATCPDATRGCPQRGQRAFLPVS
ncbi:hypothetical protein RAA17_00870 [Komagataeibacter rhaeticus]|nr:hypothetical protein [Komagataeibacter rhaeticus]